MAKPGETIDNPVSGERITFRTVASQTDGKYVEFDQFLYRKGAGATGEHVHLKGDEKYTILAGVATYTIDSVRKTAGKDEVVEILRGTIHQNPWNDGSEELHLLRHVAPEAGLEQFYETQYGLSREGKVASDGNMTFIQTVVVGNAIHSETYFFPKVLPIWLQRVSIPVIAFIGRLMGLRPYYPQFTTDNFKG
jgi:mannose-6-phosphate isomerase-like protein (cupin superfamily)